ncbi:hybrid sensor histidine kinase/response regulator transcription factor [Dysgonomonas sp. 520]|uniref:hybrid sensor histidine kinase/response regulator transcription factor n=1 Tax=Dysgonomonas sp. 520 TaxID=2302931 RepID=UPI0013D5B28D|nr:hybrid sensor histidine kinase/response regulator transcription factor [Dysgonomonas sp. 520]NDW10237.1 hybrid sensor histidine kinase/response regulator [Dysgonomonas sp. 520]
MKFNHRFIFLLLLLLIFQQAQAQPKCYFQHFGTEDGLPQHTIMDILQDKKGFLWFSTWDGLCKFDGYDFTTYKIQQGDTYHMRSNRIDHIYEDIFGHIWTLSYDREAHRFDPKAEKFMSVKSLQEYQNFTFSTQRIISMKSGRTWLISDNSGCICVKDSAFNVETFNMENGKLKGEKVYEIYEDRHNNTWILTNNGIAMLTPDGEKFNYYFSEKGYTENNRNQSFFSILEQDKFIWFGSKNGRIWKYTKKSGQFDLLDLHRQSKIPQIKEITDDKIVAITENNGFYIYEISNNNLKNYTTANLINMRSDNIVTSFVDHSKNVWLEMDCFGVAKFDSHSQTMTHFTPKIESSISTVFLPNFFIFEDRDNRVWVHPRGGGFSYYDPSNNSLMPFFNEPFSPNWKFSNMLHSAFSDKQGNMWLGTRSYGLEKVIFDDGCFRNMIVDNELHSTVSNDVRSIFEDKNQNTWISTKGGKIYVYDRNKKQLGYLCDNGKIGYGNPIPGVAYCMMQDSGQNIWIGTKGEGVFKATPKGDESYHIEQFKYAPDNIYSLSDNNIYSIFQDKRGRIWIGSYNGGLNLYENTQQANPRFINHRNNLKKYPIETGSQIRIISSDKRGNILVGTTVGLVAFPSDFESPEKIDFKTYMRIPGDDNSISGNDIFDICTTLNGQTYIATFGGGLNVIAESDQKGFPTKFKTYTTLNGLPSDVTLSIVEDIDKMLWISTESNLTKFNPKDESFETFSEIKRLIKGQNFSEASRCVTSNGDVLFGFSKGIVVFDPREVKNNTYNPYIALVKFKLFNKDIEVGEDSPLKSNIDEVDKLVLEHNQNFFSIEFAALDYIEPKNIQYAYMLKGFDSDWIYCQNQRVANYTNLQKGEYVFMVKATNSDGVWSDDIRELPIVVKPSFWETIWAYLIYTILIVSLIFISFRILFSFYRMKDKMELEHKETEMKARFFTDISHEIRTPLTMIVSPIENILQDKETPDGIKKQLQLVSKNTSRMLDMVNQILDFRKIRQTDLNVQESEIGYFVEDVCDSFTKTAEAQNVRFIVNNEVGNEKIWFDKNCVEKIVFNLLSNAFKYTPANKSIKVNIFNKNGGVAVQVEDEGVGITKEIQSRLFKRFASFNEDKNKPSTGIGLSMVKELVDKHHAKIYVESEPNVGSSFTVVFQKGTGHFDDDVHYSNNKEKSLKQELMSDPDEMEIANDSNLSSLTKDIDEKPTVLVVEDDADLRNFIKTTLEDNYTIFEAEDGKEGLEKASRLMPDLIVSDIMMPEMDGMEFLQKIRHNINTSHILFVLLTAKTTLDSKIEGLDFGADEYITKPFSVPFFKARVKNLLERRKKIQSYYQEFISAQSNKNDDTDTPEDNNDNATFAPSTPNISSRDQDFMSSVITIIEDNIDNNEFMVEDLASKVGMSRTVFFKKIKSLTGLAPIEFIRDIVIQRAAQLLETGQYSVKEVSYMVGFSDSKYFSKCFKKKYNMTPSEYKRNLEPDANAN